MYYINRPKNRTDEPVRVPLGQPLDYVGMTDYIRAWPDKLVSFVAHCLCDDDMAPFARALYEYICIGDRDGPPYEAWRKS